METTTFIEQLKERKEQREQQEKAKQAWLKELHALLDQMKAWLKEAQDNGVLQIHDKSVSLSEMGFGSYQAPGLVLLLGSSEKDAVLVHPQQKSYINADGRVDIFTQDERYILLKQVDGWYITDQTHPKTPQQLTEQSFQALLLQLWPVE